MLPILSVYSCNDIPPIPEKNQKVTPHDFTFVVS